MSNAQKPYYLTETSVSENKRVLAMETSLCGNKRL